MKRFLIVILTLLFTTITLWAEGIEGEPGTVRGTDFWTGFLNNKDFDCKTPSTLVKQTLTIMTGSKRTHVEVQTPTGGTLYAADLNPDTTVLVNIPFNGTYPLKENVGQQLPNYGLHIISNHDITVYSRSDAENSNDASFVLPTRMLGNEYMIQTYGQDFAATEFCIITTEDSTYVTIEHGPTYRDLAFSQDSTLILRKGTMLFLRSKNAVSTTAADRHLDMSGSTVCATRPVAVIAGNTNASVSFKSGVNGDHIYEQMLPIGMAGQRWIAVRASDQSRNYLRITALDNTTLTYNGTTQTLAKGATVEKNIDSQTVLLESTAPAHVYQYFRNGAHEMRDMDIDGSSYEIEWGEPSMVYLSPLSMADTLTYFNGYDLEGELLNTKNFISLVAPATDYQKIVMDSLPRSLASSFHQVPDDPNYYYAIIPFSPSRHAHKIFSTDSTAHFNSVIYGLANARSYAYSGSFTSIPTLPDLYVGNEKKTMQDTTTFCMLDSIHFNSFVPYVFDSIVWDMGNELETEFGHRDTMHFVITDRDSLEHIYQYFWAPFNDSTEYDTIRYYHVRMAVHHTSPMCQIPLIDTVTTWIRLVPQYQTLYYDTLVCQNDDSIALYHPDSILTTTQYFNPLNYEPGEYLFTDTLQTTAFEGFSCDSILYHRFVVWPIYDTTVEVSACQYLAIDELTPQTTKPNGFLWDQPSYTWTLVDHYNDSVITREYFAHDDSMLVTKLNHKAKYIEDSVMLHTDSLGCDSLVRIKLTIQPAYYTRQYKKACVMNNYTWNVADTTIIITHDETDAYHYSLKTRVAAGERRDTVNHFFYKTKSLDGCDSIIVLSLTISDTVNLNTKAFKCQNESYTWKPYVQDKDGKYVNPFSKPIYNPADPRCQSMVGVTTEMDTTIYLEEDGCPSILHLTLYIQPIYELHDTVMVCQYNSIVGNESTYAWSSADPNGQLVPHIGEGTYVDGGGVYRNGSKVNLQQIPTTTPGTFIIEHNILIGNTHSCDSTRYLHLTVVPQPTIPTTDNICGNESYTWRGKVYTPYSDSVHVGLNHYQEITHSQNDTLTCDTIWTLDLTVRDTASSTKAVEICGSEQYTWRVGTKNIVIKPQYVFDPLLGAKSDQLIKRDSVLRGQAANGCDSTVHLQLTVHPTYYNKETVEYCKGESPIDLNLFADLYWDTHHSFSDFTISPAVSASDFDELPAGKYTLTHRDVIEHGCDSTYEISVTVHNTYYDEQTATVCANEVYQWKSESGVLIQTIDAQSLSVGPHDYTSTPGSAFGCDSSFVLHLTVLPINNTPVELHLGTGVGTYDFFGDIIDCSTPGDYYRTHTLKNEHGCDSIISLHIRVDDSYFFKDSTMVCVNKPFTWTGHTGDHLTYVPKAGQTLPVYGTDGGSITITAATQQTIYEFYDNLKTTSGVDSVFQLKLYVSGYDYTIDTSVCGNQILVWEGTNYILPQVDNFSGSGSYKIVNTYDYTDQRSYLTPDGCDSIVRLHLTVLPVKWNTLDISTCSNKPVFYPNRHRGSGENLPTTPGHYTFVDTIAQHDCDCDSIITLTYDVVPSYDMPVEEVTVCQTSAGSATHTYLWNGHTNASPAHVLYKYDANNTLLDKTSAISTDQSGTFIYLDSLQTESGCDSIHTLRIHVQQTYDIADTIEICDNEVAVWQCKSYPGSKAKTSALQTYTAGEYADAIRYGEAVNNCDSIRRLVLYVHPTFQRDSFVHTFVGDQGRLNDTVFNDTLNSIHTCDSIITYHYILHPIAYDTICADTLHPEVVTGIIMDTTHIVDTTFITRLDLFVPPSHYFPVNKVTISSEETYYWDKNGQTYRGIDAIDDYIRDTINYKEGTQYGCDSIYYLEIHVGQVFRDTLKAFICQNGSYDWHRASTTGADSLVRAVPAGVPSTTTLYYDSLKTAMQFDSIYVLELYTAPRYELEKRDTVCQNKPYIWEKHEGHELLHGGYATFDINTQTPGWATYTDNLVTDSFHCDSIWTLNLYVQQTYVITDSIDICDNEIAQWECKFYHGEKSIVGTIQFATAPDSTFTAGTYRDTVMHYESVNACDSMRCLVLNVHPTYYVEIDTFSCKNEPFFYPNRFNGTGANLPVDEVGDYTYLDTLATVSGCDSIVYLTFHVMPIYDFEVEHDTICQDTSNTHYEWYTEGRLHAINIPTNTHGTFTYIDSLTTTNYGCDSIHTLELVITPSYYLNDDTITFSDESFYYWQHGLYIGEKADTATIKQMTSYEGKDVTRYHVMYDEFLSDTVKYATEHFGCDSVRNVVFRIGHVFRDTLTAFTCEGDDYEWRKTCPAGTPKTYAFHYDSLKTGLGFDSIYVLKLYTAPKYEYHFTDTICQGRPYEWHDMSIDTKTDGLYTYYDSLQTDSFLCDSVWVLHLLVPKTYNYYDTTTICEDDSVYWQNQWYKQLPAEQDSFSTYDYVAAYTSIFECDSVYHLHLRVNPIKVTTYDDELCSDSIYDFSDEDNPNLTVRPGAVTSTEDYTYQYEYPENEHNKETLHLTYTKHCKTRFGCDSTVNVNLTIYPSYRFITRDTICGDDRYDWRGQHFRKDTTVYDIKTSIHGCDSIYELHLSINPIFKHIESRNMCKNDTMFWHGKKVFWDSTQDSPDDDPILQAIYATDMGYTKKELSSEGLIIGILGNTYCDSIYELRLHYNPFYNFYEEHTVCGSETFTWRGHTYTPPTDGSVVTTYSATLLPDEETSFTVPAANIYYVTDSLRTQGCNCDSIYHLAVQYRPTFQFSTYDTICQTHTYNWTRGGQLVQAIPTPSAGDYVYTDNQQTHDGCDSTFTLYLHVSPVYDSTWVVNICQDETYRWQGKDYSGAVLGKFEQTANYTYDTTHTTIEGCDSVCHLQLSVHPTYTHEFSREVCDSTIWDGITYKDGGNYTRTYQSVHGCDSVVTMHLIVHYAFRDTTYANICKGEVYNWRGNDYNQTKVYTEFHETQYGCDSVYALNLTVNPTYEIRTEATICADEFYSFRGRLLNKTGIYYDSLLTKRGCDSVYVFQLTVLDTAAIYIVDSICNEDTYLYPENFTYEGHTYDLRGLADKSYYKTGHYRDTTVYTETGCQLFVNLDLTVVPPASITVSADQICADERELNVHYTYDGYFKPVEYSILYSEEAHEQGFEDVSHEPFNHDTADGIITIPLVKSNDKTIYPRPDYYNAVFYIHNAVCSDELIKQDIRFLIQYPSWIVEQNWNDVLTLLNQNYNGGYTFSKYQWYRNDTILEDETNSYVYLPHTLLDHGLDGSFYTVALTREDDGKTFYTCPIYPVRVDDHVVPGTIYMDVAPTYMPRTNPVVTIMTNTTGYYELYDTAGRLLVAEDLKPDEHNALTLTLPYISGCYLLYMRSEDGKTKRSVKLFVY